MKAFTFLLYYDQGDRVRLVLDTSDYLLTSSYQWKVIFLLRKWSCCHLWISILHFQRLVKAFVINNRAALWNVFMKTCPSNVKCQQICCDMVK